MNNECAGKIENVNDRSCFRRMYKMSIIGIANHLYCILWNMYKERLKSIYKRQLSGMIIAALASNRQLDWENETKRRSSLNGFVYVNAWFMFHSHFYVECEWDCCRLWKLYNACKSSTFRSKTIDTFAFHFMEWTIVSALVGMQAKSKLHFFFFSRVKCGITINICMYTS